MQEGLDFSALARQLIENGAGTEYPVPLGNGTFDLHARDPDDRDRRIVYRQIHFPRYPGDNIYGNGPAMLRDYDLPQEFIDAQNKSFRDAFALYMAPDNAVRHLCHFFRTEFLESDAYLKVERENSRSLPSIEKEESSRSFRFYTDREYPDESLTLAFEEPSRRSFKRRYYAMGEIKIAEQACRIRPNIPKSIFAFQAGQLDYLYNLANAFDELEGVDPQRKKTCRAAVEELIKGHNTGNFARELLPAICLAYYARDPGMKSEVVAKDFEEGFRLGHRLGLFRHNVDGPNDGLERKFVCPAATTIGAVMGRSEESQDLFGSPGNMLAMIYRMIGAPEKPGPVSSVCPIPA